jgi:predicted phosphodiesterase
MTIRVAILSDLHLEAGEPARAACEDCSGTMAVDRPGDVDECGCGRCHLSIDNHGQNRMTGNVRSLPGPFALCPDAADVVILAGDIHTGTRGIRFAAENFAGVPVFYVAGNHEAYGWDLENLQRELKTAAAATPNVRVLECDAAEILIRGVKLRILGATTWTDYCLNGDEVEDIREAFRHAISAEDGSGRSKGISDHRRITYRGNPVAPGDLLRLHERSRCWLEDQLAAETDADATIVAVHHGVSPLCLSPVHRGDKWSTSFASNLEDMIGLYAPDVVISGHTHHSHDFPIGDSRVVSNQKGYPGEIAGEFKPLIIQVEPRAPRLSRKP